MMRRVIPFLLVLFLSPPAFSQEFHWGVRGGIPLSKYFRTAINFNGAAGSSTGYVSTTNRYTVGPVVEVGLPFRLGVESGALYKRQHFSRIEFRSTSGPGFPIDISVITETTANAWEFPFLLKFHASDRPVGTFVEVGPSLQVLTHV